MRTVVFLRLRYGAYGARSIVASDLIASPCRCVWLVSVVLKRVSLWAMQLSGIKASNVIGIVSRCNNVFINGFTFFRALVALSLLIPISAQAAKLPKLIKIDGQPWAIKQVDLVDSQSNLDGSTECAIRTIFLLKSMEPFQKADIILHEVQHAFTCERGEVHNEKYDNDGKTEHCDGHCGIYFAAPKWHTFIRENPELIRYIIDTDEPQLEVDPPWLIQQPIPPR